MNEKMKDFLKKYEFKIILVIGFLLVASVSFEFGYIQGKIVKSIPVSIELPPESPKIGLGGQVDAIMESNSTADKNTQNKVNSQISASCTFVGSKNSNKFHLPTCSFAKRIKPENIVCFKSAEEAVAQGRVGDKGCIK